MKTSNSLESLQELIYSGKMANKQFTEVTVVDYTILSAVQYNKFTNLMVGLKAYSPEELYVMNSTKKNKIFKRNKQAQTMLNIWKQEKMLDQSSKLGTFASREINKITVASKIQNSYANEIRIEKDKPLPDVFTLAALSKLLSVDVQPDPKFICSLSFKDLGIKKNDIINKLITEKFLPVDFATL